MLNEYVDANYDETMQCAPLTSENVEPMVNAYMNSKECKELLKDLEKDYLVPADVYKTMYAEMIKGMLQGYIAMSSAGMNPGTDTEVPVPEEEVVEDETPVSRAVTTEDITIPAGTEIPDGIELPGMEETPEVPDEEDDGQNDPVPEMPQGAILTKDMVSMLVTQFVAQEAVQAAADEMASVMTEAVMQKNVLTEVGGLTADLMGTMATAFNVDPDNISGAFQFNMDEDELSRLMETMMTSGVEQNADTNLLLLGYQETEKQ